MRIKSLSFKGVRFAVFFRGITRSCTGSALFFVTSVTEGVAVSLTAAAGALDAVFTAGDDSGAGIFAAVFAESTSDAVLAAGVFTVVFTAGDGAVFTVCTFATLPATGVLATGFTAGDATAVFTAGSAAAVLWIGVFTAVPAAVLFLGTVRTAEGFAGMLRVFISDLLKLKSTLLLRSAASLLASFLIFSDRLDLFTGMASS